MTQSNRFLPYTRWPDALSERYRAKGYWRGEPLTAMLARQCELAPTPRPFSAASAASAMASWTPPRAGWPRIWLTTAWGRGYSTGAAPQRG